MSFRSKQGLGRLAIISLLRKCVGAPSVDALELRSAYATATRIGTVTAT